MDERQTFAYNHPLTKTNPWSVDPGYHKVPHQQQEIVNLVTSGKKTAADAARLFNVHPATVSRLLQRAKSP